MLRLDDVDACIPLVQELEQKGLKLDTKIGPLSALCSELSVAVSSCGSMAALGDDVYQTKLADICGILHETSASTARVEGGSIFDCSNHDLKTEEFAEMIKTGVLATVQKAKGIAIPLIKRLEDAIAAKLLSYEDRGINTIMIEEAGIDSVLDNEEVFEFFSEFKEIRRISIAGVQCFPELDDIQLAKLVESGSPEINEHLTSKLTLQTASGNLGGFIYRYLFQGDGRGHNPVEIFELRNLIRDIYGDYCVLEGLMLAFYMGQGLITNMPDGVNANLADLEHRMKIITSILGMMIYGILKTHREQLGSKTLLPSGLPYVDRRVGDLGTNPKIIVNKEVYAGFLADGGSPELLFGSMVSDRIDNPAYLIENAAKYEKAYADFVALNRSYTASNKVSLYVDAIRDEVYDAFNDDETLKLIDKTSGVFVRLADRLKRLGASDIKCEESTYAFLKSLVCYVVFPDTPDVEKVISDIDNFECAEGEENFNTSEIACMVLIDLIVDWLLDQVEVRAV